MTRTRALLTDLGHDVVDASLAFDFESFTKHVHVIWCVGTSAGIAAIAASTGRKPSLDTLESATLACYEDALEDDRRSMSRARSPISTRCRERSDATSRASTCCCRRPLDSRRRNTAWSIRTRPVSTASRGRARRSSSFRSRRCSMRRDSLAISLPLHWSKDGLPMGSQFVGRFGDEATLLRLAAQIEQAAPWAARMPALIQ